MGKISKNSYQREKNSAESSNTDTAEEERERAREGVGHSSPSWL